MSFLYQSKVGLKFRSISNRSYFTGTGTSVYCSCLAKIVNASPVRTMMRPLKLGSIWGAPKCAPDSGAQASFGLFFASRWTAAPLHYRQPAQADGAQAFGTASHWSLKDEDRFA
jgi:hypothetical protein